MSLKHYLFLGDSITDAGHLWEADPRMLGDGFIRKISESTAFSSAHLVNRGQDGFTSAALLRLVRRMTDLDTFTTITVLIGVNDLPVAFYTDPTWIRTTFAPSVQALFELLTSAGSKKLLIMEPFLFTPPDSHSHLLPLLLQEQQILQAYAAACDAVYIPLQEALQAAIDRLGTAAVTTDGIHLTPAGNQILADAWIRSCLRE
ncbi:MAG: GDSL-type esterase/lipase family protein [Lachnospiraceae bacterium]